MGQIPGLGSPTSNINVPFGVRGHRVALLPLAGHQGAGPRCRTCCTSPSRRACPKAMAPLMLPIELISHLSRVLSLTLRLFGNIFGEHLVVLDHRQHRPVHRAAADSDARPHRRTAAGVHLHDADGDLPRVADGRRRTSLEHTASARHSQSKLRRSVVQAWPPRRRLKPATTCSFWSA